MMTKFVPVLVLLGVITLTTTLSRPKYILPCSISKNFDECAIAHAKYAIPFLSNGDKQLKIPSMNPLRIPLVELEGSNNFNLRLRDLDVHGIARANPITVKADFNTKVVYMKTFVDRITLTGEYEMDGRLLVLPLNGNGPLNMTLFNGMYEYEFQHKIDMRNGKKYAKIINSTYNYELENVHYDFQNLFNGDKELGEQMNKFMNENWRLVDEDLKKPILKILLTLHDDVTNKILSKIPYDELFLP